MATVTVMIWPHGFSKGECPPGLAALRPTFFSFWLALIRSANAVLQGRPADMPPSKDFGDGGGSTGLRFQLSNTQTTIFHAEAGFPNCAPQGALQAPQEKHSPRYQGYTAKKCLRLCTPCLGRAQTEHGLLLFIHMAGDVPHSDVPQNVVLIHSLSFCDLIWQSDFFRSVFSVLAAKVQEHSRLDKPNNRSQLGKNSFCSIGSYRQLCLGYPRHIWHGVAPSG